MKTRREIAIGVGSTLDGALGELKQLSNLYDNEFEYYGKFNGVELNSTMSIDDVYMALMRMTKIEYDNIINQRRLEREKVESEFELNKPDLIKNYKNKARGIVRECKLDKWDELVPIRVDDLYQGLELGNALDLIKMLDIDKEPFIMTKDKFMSHNHSGMSASLMLQLLKEFSIYGEEFVDYIEE